MLISQWYRRPLKQRKRLIQKQCEYNLAHPVQRQQTVRKFTHSNKRKRYAQKWNQVQRYGHIIPLIKCELCGSIKRTSRNLVIHHKDGCNGNGCSLNNTRDNLIVLCRSCHPKVHYHGEIRVNL